MWIVKTEDDDVCEEVRNEFRRWLCFGDCVRFPLTFTYSLLFTSHSHLPIIFPMALLVEWGDSSSSAMGREKICIGRGTQTKRLQSLLPAMGQNSKNQPAFFFSSHKNEGKGARRVHTIKICLVQFCIRKEETKIREISAGMKRITLIKKN